MRLPHLLSLLVLPLTADLAFAPAAGSRVRKTLECSAELREEIVLIAEGAVPFAVTGSVDRELVLVDTYRELAATRPADLARRIERARATIATELSTVVDGEAQSFRIEKKLQSELEGLPLVFRWDAARGAMAARLENAGDDLAAELAAVREDTDLRGFLPEPGAPLAAGARWQVGASALADVFGPCGDLSFRFASEGHFAHEDFHTLGLELGAACAALPGEVDVRFVGMDEERPAIAHLAVAFSSADAAALRAPLAARARERSNREVTFGVEPEAFTLRGKGEIEWDTARKRFHAAKFEAELAATWRLEARSAEATNIDRRTMNGTIRVTARAVAE